MVRYVILAMDSHRRSIPGQAAEAKEIVSSCCISTSMLYNANPLVKPCLIAPVSRAVPGVTSKKQTSMLTLTVLQGRHAWRNRWTGLFRSRPAPQFVYMFRLLDMGITSPRPFSAQAHPAHQQHCSCPPSFSLLSFSSRLYHHRPRRLRPHRCLPRPHPSTH